MEIPEGFDAVQTLPVKHVLTDPERLELSGKLARATQRIGELQEEKKQAATEFKSRIEFAQAEANLVANKVSSGTETRETVCNVLFHADRKTKSIYDAGTGELLGEREMGPDDFQRPLEILTTPTDNNDNDKNKP